MSPNNRSRALESPRIKPDDTCSKQSRVKKRWGLVVCNVAKRFRDVRWASQDIVARHSQRFLASNPLPHLSARGTRP